MLNWDDKDNWTEKKDKVNIPVTCGKKKSRTKNKPTRQNEYAGWFQKPTAVSDTRAQRFS